MTYPFIRICGHCGAKIQTASQKINICPACHQPWIEGKTNQQPQQKKDAVAPDWF